MTIERRTERARLIGQMAGKIDYLKSLEEREDIGGIGDYSSVYDNMLRQVLADMQKINERLRAIVIEG